MNRINVSSTNVASVGYIWEEETLEVEFLNGSLYQYYGVPNSIFIEMLASPSKGGFVHEVLKGMFDYARVR